MEKSESNEKIGSRALIENGDHIWFTADTHLDHENIMRYCNRPFANVAEMNKTILDNINARVRESDSLRILGDFAWARDKRDMINAIRRFRNQIACRNITLILGNHDPKQKNYMPKEELIASRIFSNVFQAEMVSVGDCSIYLHHYACRVWPSSHHGSWHLFGHTHGTLLPESDQLHAEPRINQWFEDHSYSCDIGVDCHGFKPLNLNDIAAIMKKKKWIDPLKNIKEETRKRG